MGDESGQLQRADRSWEGVYDNKKRSTRSLNQTKNLYIANTLTLLVYVSEKTFSEDNVRTLQKLSS